MARGVVVIHPGEGEVVFTLTRFDGFGDGKHP
jgi:hypothetical protein